MGIDMLMILAQASETGFGEWMGSALSIFLVILFFGFCIFIHEVGHFLAAKWRGLHIVAFSIGFKKIWGFKYKGVEYRIGCLPFGGYVDLPQVDSSDETPHDENGNPLPRVSPVDRILVALAGPVFNIISGLLIGILIWCHGLETLTPVMDHVVVRDVNHTSPEYKAGLRDGDVIVAVNGKSFNGTWEKFAENIVYHDGSVSLTVQHAGAKDSVSVITYTPAANNERLKEGIAYPFFNPVIPASVSPLQDSPAARAGIREGDVIVAMDVNGMGRQSITERSQVISRLTVHGVNTDTIPCKVWVRRAGEELAEPFLVAAKRASQTIDLGIAFATQPYAEVTAVPDTSLLHVGDWILAVNGQTPRSYDGFREMLTQDSDVAVTLNLSVYRDGRRVEVSAVSCNGAGFVAGRYDFKPVNGIVVSRVTNNTAAATAGLSPKSIILDSAFLQMLNRTGFAAGSTVPLTYLPSDADELKTIQITVPVPYQIGVMMRYVRYPDPFTQFNETVTATARTLSRIFNRNSQISVKHMSGPVNIVNVVHKMSKYNIWGAVSLIAMISFSLGLLNLFPLPILDGGHILLGLIQIVTRRPMPAKVLRPIMNVFFFLLIGLMLYVTYNDVVRVSQNFESDEFSASLASPDKLPAK